MGRLSPEEKSAREAITRWFLYFRETFYRREDQPDIRFAKDLGISRSLVSDVVSGKKQVGFDVALKMRQVFKRKLDELVYKEPPKEEADPVPTTDASPRPFSRGGRRSYGAGK